MAASAPLTTAQIQAMQIDIGVKQALVALNSAGVAAKPTTTAGSTDTVTQGNLTDLINKLTAAGILSAT